MLLAPVRSGDGHLNLQALKEPSEFDSQAWLEAGNVRLVELTRFALAIGHNQSAQRSRLKHLREFSGERGQHSVKPESVNGEASFTGWDERSMLTINRPGPHRIEV